MLLREFSFSALLKILSEETWQCIIMSHIIFAIYLSWPKSHMQQNIHILLCLHFSLKSFMFVVSYPQQSNNKTKLWGPIQPPCLSSKHSCSISNPLFTSTSSAQASPQLSQVVFIPLGTLTDANELSKQSEIRLGLGQQGTWCSWPKAIKGP